ncbi:hypothetical protein [Nodosilinea sp. E11]|uniref:hypothetical protein n=1 Tax=Nodosilinea sp. E11 TaxID=3037479 RepID=UPI002934AD81|nr:hypothetical protein [Nodosilinea sp. E11]WOD38796.1 hypothetical protein RRF56_21570 [Nodosilinea sp. E11]
MTTLIAGQIVFLECRHTRLYAEVIQVLETRQMGWLRPLALVHDQEISPLGTAFGLAQAGLDLTTPDMLWPLNQLQPALDTDVIPLLTTLTAKASANEQTLSPISHPGQMTVTEFVRQFWAEYQANWNGESPAPGLG